MLITANQPQVAREGYEWSIEMLSARALCSIRTESNVRSHLVLMIGTEKKHGTSGNRYERQRATSDKINIGVTRLTYGGNSYNGQSLWL